MKRSLIYIAIGLLLASIVDLILMLLSETFGVLNALTLLVVATVIVVLVMWKART